MRAAPLILGLCVAASTWGCLDATEPSRILSVHRSLYGVVEVGSPMVRVLAEDVLENETRVPLEGADAVVRGSFGSWTLTEGAAGPGACFVGSAPASGAPGCYTGLLPEPPSGGDSLVLDVNFPDGGLLHGALRAPDVPIASIPADSQRVTVLFRSDVFPIAVVPVDLASAVGADRADILPLVVAAHKKNDSIDPATCVVSASSVPFVSPPLQGRDDLLIHGVRCLRNGASLRWDSLDLVVQVVAMERNYAEYTERILCSGLIEEPRAGFGIEGAVGVFGAVAVAELPLRLVFGGVEPVPEDRIPPTYPC